MEISSAGTTSFAQSPISNGGRVSFGRPLGTVPTILTPCSVSPKPQTAAVVTAMATTGPTFATMSAVRSLSPNLRKRGLRPRRTQKRKASDAKPITAV